MQRPNSTKARDETENAELLIEELNKSLKMELASLVPVALLFFEFDTIQEKDFTIGADADSKYSSLSR